MVDDEPIKAANYLEHAAALLKIAAEMTSYDHSAAQNLIQLAAGFEKKAAALAVKPAQSLH